MRTEAKAQFSNFCEYEAPSSSYPWQAKGSGAADFAVGTMSGTTNIVGTAAEAGQLTDRTKEWPTKPSNAKETNSELGNLFEAESNKIKATPGHSKRIITKPQRYGTHKCRHATDRSQTQEPKFVGYQEIRIDELPGRLSRSQPSLKAEAVAKLRAELEQVQKDLPQPLPRNTFVKKDKEVLTLMQELSEKTNRIQNLETMKQKLENEANDIRQRLEETERNGTLLSAR